MRKPFAPFRHRLGSETAEVGASPSLAYRKTTRVPEKDRDLPKVPRVGDRAGAKIQVF